MKEAEESGEVPSSDTSDTPALLLPEQHPQPSLSSDLFFSLDSPRSFYFSLLVLLLSGTPLPTVLVCLEHSFYSCSVQCGSHYPHVPI